MRQEQFLEVINRDEAEQRFHSALKLEPLGDEKIDLAHALDRVLAEDVVAQVDVPSFDRSNFDGFAIRAEDSFGTDEQNPRSLELLDEIIATAVVPKSEVKPGQAVVIATGGMLPRGADAVMMVEHTDEGANENEVIVRRAITAGFGVAFAGTDISAGEVVLRKGDLLTSRETAVLAAIGHHQVQVFRRPRVAIISTGDEIIPPDQEMQPGLIFDSNARILADAVTELGGDPIYLGIVHDDFEQLKTRTLAAADDCDLVLLSGGTSKGAGDISYRVVSQETHPGILAHGVALKPGKPICLAAHNEKPVVILPGFPTSAIFTFHEFVAPVIETYAGRRSAAHQTQQARLAVKVNSEIGRTEYLLVGLIGRDDADDGPPLAAYPMGKGSGSVTAFSRADGFVTIGRHEEIVPAGTTVEVRMLGRDLPVADMVVIGSHCVGLDFLLGLLHRDGYHTKFIAVGSMGGLEAAAREECDLAGIHLLDEDSNEYNRPFLREGMELVQGYGRLQGVVHRQDDSRFANKSPAEVAEQSEGRGLVMVNRNRGSGTRVLIDQLLDGRTPTGYPVQSKSHNAVAAAVSQNRADWGVAIETVANSSGLGFIPLVEERYDFVIPTARLKRPAVVRFLELLQDAGVKEELQRLGFRT